jgi:glycosyltransferase involved in cell wall biosynthesis
MATHTISLITCAYNPSEEIFKRVLDAVSKLDRSNVEAEYIIVDNNSKIPVEKLNYVQEFLKENSWARVVLEKEPGLTAARICGYNQSTADLLLFIDDDVELASDYLQKAVSLFGTRPDAGACNAGRIEVDYISTPKGWFIKKGKSYFQQSDLASDIWGSEKNPADFTPFGTGLCLRRDVFRLYKGKVENKEFSLSDRIGNKTTSCGDSQIVICAVELNYKIGRSPMLRLNHLVSDSKATTAYLRRLNFGLNYSFQLFKKESVPEVYSARNRFSIFFKVFVYNTIHLIPQFDFRTYRITMAGTLGACHADFKIQKKGIPVWLSFFSWLFGIDNTSY